MWLSCSEVRHRIGDVRSARLGMRLNIVDLTASPTDAALGRQPRFLPNRREAPFKSSIVDRTRVDYKYPEWESYKGYNLIVARCRFQYGCAT